MPIDVLKSLKCALMLALCACGPSATTGGTDAARVCDELCPGTCIDGECVSPCELASRQKSYLGCDYWPTVLPNRPLASPDEYHFAVAVANPGRDPTYVSIALGATTLVRETVGAGDSVAFTLPWVPELRDSLQDSVLVRAGAYHLLSSLPVAVYQFNPLEHSVLTAATPSYSNDASLLLPTPVLTGEYMALSRATFAPSFIEPLMNPPVEGYESSIQGYVAVVATQDDTTVTLDASAHTVGIGVSLRALAPGDTAEVSLNQGDVLVVKSHPRFPVDFEDPSRCTKYPGGARCTAGRDYDLTGTRVNADRPVAVFSGHECAFVPWNRYACDHLEEQLFPVETIGRSATSVSTDPQVPYEPNLFRVVSAGDNNQITFFPARIHDPVTLGAGDFVEVMWQGPIRVVGTQRTLVGQFMVGEDFTAEAPVPPDIGDPSLALVVPEEQWRTSYDFYAPETFALSYANIIAPAQSLVAMDGEPVPPGQPIEGTDLVYVRYKIPAGPHRAWTTDEAPFGIMVTGIAPYTSYMYPAGLKVAPIVVE